MSAVGADPGGPTTTSGTEGPLETTQRLTLQSEDWEPPGRLVTDTQDFPLCRFWPSTEELQGLYTLDGGTRYNFTIPGASPSDTGHEFTLIFVLYYPPPEPLPVGFQFESAQRMEIVVNDVAVPPLTTETDPLCARMTYNPNVDTSFVNERGVTGTLRLSTSEFPVNSRLPQMLVTAAAVQFTQVVGPSQGSTPFPSLGGTLTVDPSTVLGGTSRDTSVPSSNPNAISPSSGGGGGPKASVVVPAVLVPLLAIAAGALVFVLWRRRRRSRMAPSAAFRADHPEGMVAIHRDDGAVGYAGGSTSPILAQSPTPAQSPFFPYDNKRPFTP